MYGLEAVALRYSNVYGPRQNPHGEAGVVAIFGKRLLAGEPITIYGDGEQTRDLVYVEDVAAANLLAAERPVRSLTSLDARAYNIGTGMQTSVNRWPSSSPGCRPAREVRRAPTRAGELLRSALDVSKAERELGWTPRVDVAEGLARTVRWIAEGCVLLQVGRAVPTSPWELVLRPAARRRSSSRCWSCSRSFPGT